MISYLLKRLWQNWLKSSGKTAAAPVDASFLLIYYIIIRVLLQWGKQAKKQKHDHLRQAQHQFAEFHVIYDNLFIVCLFMRRIDNAETG